LSGLIDENRAQLAERGEKLHGLHDMCKKMYATVVHLCMILHCHSCGAKRGLVYAHRVEGLSGVMNENRARLAERGEKLRGLQDKMEAMSSDAEDFASMAKRLRDREANKKWWQL